MNDQSPILRRPDDIRNPLPRRGAQPAPKRDEEAHAAFVRHWLEAGRQKNLQDRVGYIADGCRKLLRDFELPDEFGQYLVCGESWERAEEDPEKLPAQKQAIHERAHQPFQKPAEAVEYIVNCVRHPALLSPPNSYQYAAATLLDHCDYAQELLASGRETVEAMRIGLEIGTRAATLAIVRRWEPDALDGEHLRTVVRSKGGKGKAIAEEVKDAVICEHRRRLADQPAWAKRKKKAEVLHGWVLTQKREGRWDEEERLPSKSLIEKWIRELSS